MSVTGTGKAKTERFYIDHEAGTKRCSRCLQVKPLGDYYSAGVGRIAGSWCRSCKKRQMRLVNERKRGYAVRRPPRRNEAGDYRCSGCNQYKSRPNFTGQKKVSIYCKDCKRSYGRELYRMRMRDPEYRAQRRAAQNARNRAAAREALAERRAFIRTAISTLRRRGFTYADIAALGGFSRNSVRRWPTATGFVTEAVAETFGVLMVATASYPVGPTEKVNGRQHPDRAALAAKVAPGIAAIGRRKGQQR